MEKDTERQPVRLRATGLSKRYGAVQALKEVDFELRAGEIVALLGENGAGKSTLVKVLSGLVIPDDGTIEVNGELADISSSSKSQAAGIAVVQQEYSTVPALSVAENLALGRADARFFWSPKLLRAKSKQLLAEVGLDHISPRTKVKHLSVAEMQLLEIARVLARDAQIVIFDEPTAALSDAEANRVMEVVRRLAARGISIIYVTHRLPEVFEVSETIAVFRNGRSLTPVKTADADVEKVIRLMLGRDIESMFPERPRSFGAERLVIDDVVVAGMASAVTLRARRGEILGLTGQLGSGADLVVKALASEAEVLSGRIEVDGQQLQAKTRAQGLEQGIAYCSPDRKRNGIFAGVSILRNLSSSWLRSISRGSILNSSKERSRAKEYAQSFAIDLNRMSSNVGQLSGGNQQKVALARWLGNEPVVFLVEEPTRGVDVGARSDIYAKLRGLCEQGMTLVVSSSDTAEIHGLCDTIATFYHGHLVAVKPADEWTDDALVAAVMNRSEAA